MHLKSLRPGDRLRRFFIWIVNCVSSFIKRSLWTPKNLFVKALLIVLNFMDYRRLYQNILEKLKTFYLRNLVFIKGLFKVNQCISLDLTSTNWTMKRTQDAVPCKAWSWFRYLLTCVSCSPHPSLVKLSADQGIVGKYRSGERTRALHNNRGEGSTVQRCAVEPLVIQLYGFCNRPYVHFFWPYIKGITQSTVVGFPY